MTPARALLSRDITLAFRAGGGAMLAVAFFGTISALVPLGVGAELELLGRIAGGVLWVWGFGLLGYFFGNTPVVKENFGLAIIAVILISLLPIGFEAWRARRSAARLSS